MNEAHELLNHDWDNNRDLHPIIQSTLKLQFQDIQNYFQNCQTNSEIIELLQIITYSRDSALHLALRNRSIQIVDYLLNFYEETKTSVSSPNQKNEIPLHIAIKFKLFKQAKRIIKMMSKEEINFKNDMGETALHICCHVVDNIVNPRKFSIIEETINYNENGEEYPSDQSSQPARSVSWNNHFVTFSSIDQHKQTNGQQDGENDENNNLDTELPQIISVLIDHGADISIRNKEGKNIFHLAATNQMISVLQYLLQDESNKIYLYRGIGPQSEDDMKEETTEKPPKNKKKKKLTNEFKNGEIVVKTKKSPLFFLTNFFYQNVIVPTLRASWLLKGEESKKAQRKGDDFELEELKTYPEFSMTPFHLALKSGHIPTVKLLLFKGAHIEQIDRRGNTPAHFATLSGNMELVTFLETNYKVNFQGALNNFNESVLHLAASEGFDELITHFLSLGIDIHIRNREKFTPLHYASRAGHLGTVELLVSEFGANVNAKTKNKVTPLFLASKFHHFEVMEFLLDWGADPNSNNKTQSTPLRGALEKLTDPEELVSVVKLLVEHGASVFIKKAEPKIAAKVLNCVVDFPSPAELEENPYLLHKPRMPFAMITLLKYLDNPNTFLNKNLERILFRLHEDESGPQLIGQLVLLSIAIKEAIQFHPVEAVFLQKRFNQVDDIIVSCMESPVMDEYDKFITMMCLNPFVSKGLPPNLPLIKKRIDSDVYELTSDAKITMFSNGPLNLCMRFDLSALCGTVQVATVSSVAFWDHLKQDFNHTFIEYFSLKSITYEGILDMRSRPIFMFFIEGLSKFFLLLLCAFVTIRIYSLDEYPSIYVAEYLLVIMMSTNIIYEIGQLQDMDWKLTEYISSAWNQLDWISIILVFLWTISRFIFPKSYYFGKAALSLASIPSSLNLLRYLSIHQSSGVLVIMIMRVLFDMGNFLMVFLLGVVGFGIALMGLFNSDNTSGFPNVKESFFTLFASGMGNFDVSTLHGPYKDLGGFLVVIYVVFVLVLLLNLLIARMADTHTKVDNKAFHEWALMLAKNAKNYMLLQEKSPLCMLPAPLNIFPTLLAPFHYLKLYVAQSEGRKIKRETKIDAKQKAVVIASQYSFEPGSRPTTPSKSPKTLKTPEKPPPLKEQYVVSLAGSLSDDIINLTCFPFLVIISLPVRVIEFIAKFMRNEKWYKLPIALIVAIPFVLSLSIYHSIRMLYVSFKQMTVLKLDHFGQAKKFDVEHGFKFDREKGWDAPSLLEADLDPIINTRRSQMWHRKNHKICHKKEEWYSDDDLKRIFQQYIPSRYPPDTEVVDKLMMSKMDTMMKIIQKFEDKNLK